MKLLSESRVKLGDSILECEHCGDRLYNNRYKMVDMDTDDVIYVCRSCYGDMLSWD